jgi:hypothetical protein
MVKTYFREDHFKGGRSGVPVPLGTVHRLDAISKSFFGR